MPGPVLQILDMSYHDLLNSLKDIKMQVFLPYFVRKAKGYYNAQLLDFEGAGGHGRTTESFSFGSSGQKPYYIILFTNFPFTVNNNTKYQHLLSLKALSYKTDIIPYYIWEKQGSKK